ncbi:MAG: hypothetical protein K0U82_11475, partial [Planctomycetes bacterium]|nr:hypothetical protein [Planctomycetota bacterium]
EEWTPPENPDPQTILNEAQSDALAKRYEIALAKHIWFHKNATKLQPAMIGVRLSFALSYWHDLGKVYPPAIERLKETRDQASKNVLNGKQLTDSFHDFVSINRTLGENAQTVDTFILLDMQNKKSAKKVYHMARRALIKGKEYKLCGKYLDPKQSFPLTIKQYTENKKMAKNPQLGKDFINIANLMFKNEVTTLIALLVVNDRKKEANEIAVSAKMEWDNPDFHAAIDKALEGNVPTPWP